MAVARGSRHRKARAKMLAAATHCWLCGEPLRFDVGPRHPMSPTADHVVPVIDGGLDVIENYAPAHRRCNSRRGRRAPSSLQTRQPGAEGW